MTGALLDDDLARHVAVAGAARDAAAESESSRCVRWDREVFCLTRSNGNIEAKITRLEAVVALNAREADGDFFAFLEADFFLTEFPIGDGHGDDARLILVGGVRCVGVGRRWRRGFGAAVREPCDLRFEFAAYVRQSSPKWPAASP